MSGVEPPPNPGILGNDSGGKIDGSHKGARFPSWGDTDGSMGKLIMLRLEAASGSLPKDPFLIRKSVELHLGAGIEGGFPENKGTTYALKIRNPAHSRKLKELTQLISGLQIRVTDHPTLNQTRCKISCADAIEYTDEELRKNLEPQGVIDIRRITRQEGQTRKNTPTIILTVQGTTMPEYIFIGFVRCKTQQYYPAPMLCFGCWKFGHTRARCPTRGEQRCGHCSDTHVVTAGIRCSNDPHCNRCDSGEHPLYSRKCPAYVKEEEIQHIRIDMGISYPAASRIHDQRSGNSTSAAVVNASNETRFNELSAKMKFVIRQLQLRDQKIDLLMKENAIQQEKLLVKDTKIAELEAALKSRTQHRLHIAKEQGSVSDILKQMALKDGKIKTKRIPSPTNESAIPSNDQNAPKNNPNAQRKKKLNKKSSNETTDKRTRNISPSNSEPDQEMTTDSPPFQPIGTNALSTGDDTMDSDENLNV